MTVLVNPSRFIAVSYTTLNSADKAAAVTLSGSNLVASGTIVGSGFVRSVKAITVPTYFEGVFTTITGAGANIAVGVAKSTATLTSAMGYSTADAWSVWGPGVGARSNGTTAYAASTVSGDVIGVAVDPSAGKIWLRINGGAWLGAGNPTAGTSPTFSGLTGTLYAGACPWNNTSVITMRFNPSSFGTAAPSGFSALFA